MQAYLDRLERQPEDIACLRIGETLKIGKYQNGPVIFRKIVHEAANALVHILPYQERVVQWNAVNSEILIRRFSAFRGAIPLSR